jgi:hypothetical protein
VGHIHQKQALQNLEHNTHKLGTNSGTPYATGRCLESS